MNGINYKALRINLTKLEISEENISTDIIEDYLGGRGLGVKLFADSVPAKIDPLSEKNHLIFSVGPFTSLDIPTSGIFCVTTKSPLTNTIFSSNSGGLWGTIFKNCGYDCLIIEGKRPENDKSYIVIDGKTGIDIKNAESLWGLKTDQCIEDLRNSEGKDCQVLCIGPAGEKLVKFSSIINQVHKAFGRGGVGAVMGSKGLKAIVVKNGTKMFDIKDKLYLKKINTVAIDKIKVVPITSQGFHLFGTSVLIKVINLFGMLPINNHQKAFIQNENEINEISGENLRNNFLKKEEGCYNCIIKCGRITNTGETIGKGPEFESLWALGPQIGIFDLKTIIRANHLCNDLGLDAISTGVTISCAMELSEKGIIQDNILKFGNKKEICDLIEKIALKEDIGTDLSEGSLRFSKKYNAEKYSMQVKGLELPAYDPRGAFGNALGYAVSNRGACNLTGSLIGLEVLGVPKKLDRFSITGKADLLFLKQNQSAVEDSLVVCEYSGYAVGLDFQVRFIKALTGQNYDLLTIGERIYNLERLFNIREGFTRKDDCLPERFLKEPLKDGPSANKIVPLDFLIDEYYNVRGWDKNGIPTNKTIERLALKKLI